MRGGRDDAGATFVGAGDAPGIRAPAIRAAAAADVAGVLALWRTDGGAPGATDSEESLAGLLARDPGALLVAGDGGRIVGALIAAWDGWRGNLYRLVVSGDRRRRGIALALVAAAEQRLRAQGAVRIAALVDSDDEAAHAFWAAAGYVHQPRRGRWLKHP